MNYPSKVVSDRNNSFAMSISPCDKRRLMVWIVILASSISVWFILPESDKLTNIFSTCITLDSSRSFFVNSNCVLMEIISLTCLIISRESVASERFSLATSSCFITSSDNFWVFAFSINLSSCSMYVLAYSLARDCSCWDDCSRIFWLRSTIICLILLMVSCDSLNWLSVICFFAVIKRVSSQKSQLMHYIF